MLLDTLKDGYNRKVEMSMIQKRHFVVFSSMLCDEVSYPIDAWDTKIATAMAKGSYRYGPRPYGFRFETRIISDPIDDGFGGKLDVNPRIIERSPLHYLGGYIETLAEVEARADPNEEILRENMRINNIESVVVFNGTARFFLDGDILLDGNGNVANC